MDQVCEIHTIGDDDGRLTSTGIGPIPSIYFSEAFPLSHRELGAAFTICVNNAVGSALSLTFPSLLAKVTPTGGMSHPTR